MAVSNLLAFGGATWPVLANATWAEDTCVTVAPKQLRCQCGFSTFCPQPPPPSTWAPCWHLQDHSRASTSLGSPPPRPTLSYGGEQETHLNYVHLILHFGSVTACWAVLSGPPPPICSRLLLVVFEVVSLALYSLGHSVSFCPQLSDQVHPFDTNFHQNSSLQHLGVVCVKFTCIWLHHSLNPPISKYWFGSLMSNARLFRQPDFMILEERRFFTLLASLWQTIYLCHRHASGYKSSCPTAKRV